MFPEKKLGQLIGPAAMLTHGLKKCPLCEHYVFNQKDLDDHMPTHWQSARNGGEWMPAEADPHMREILRNVGTMVKDGYRYMLIHDGQTIFRKRSM